MNYPSCRAAFEDGIKTRRLYPLHNGLYKLTESKNRIQMSKDEVRRIIEVVKGVRCPLSLRHCTNEDKAVWLRDAPTNVAYRMGYEIIPGLRALQFDGMSQQQAEFAASMVESEMHQCIDEWDYLRNKFNLRISAEYSQMRNGKSYSLLVVNDALRVIEEVIKILPSYIQDDLRM